MSCFIPKDELMIIKSIDLYTYFKTVKPDELVKHSAGDYKTKTHSSLHMSNGLWNYFNGGIGGKNAVDYFMKMEGYSFIKACNKVKNDMNINGKSDEPVLDYQNRLVRKELILPPKNDNNNVVIKYLISRGIDIEIIKDGISDGVIYEDTPYRNAIFVGKNEEGEPRYCAIRSTNNSNIKRESYGSDKTYSFRLLGTNKYTIYLFESAIDTLSFATFLKIVGKNYKDYNLISLAGIYQVPIDNSKAKLPKAIEKILEDNKEIKTIYLCFDNDNAGRSASNSFKKLLENDYKIIDFPPKTGKDYNDFLVTYLSINDIVFGDCLKKKSKELVKEKG